MAIYPTTEQELIQAVALAAKTHTKIKVVSKGSHSATKLVCPGGNQGLIVSTRDYNSLIHVNATSKTVTADAGVMLRDLVDTIADYGLTLPHTPYWEGVSVAGMISTGAHGSGMWGRGSAPHDYVVGLRLITAATEEEGYVKVIDLAEGDEDLDAARLSLGVLGAISKVTFQLEPMFKRSVKLELRGDERLEDEILEFAKEHEFGGLSWYPSSGKALFKLDNRVSVDAEGEGAHKLATLDKMEVGFIEGLTAALDASEERQNTDELCQGADMLMNYRHSSADGLVNEGSSFTGYPVVGYNHKMQTAGGCQKEVSPLITPTAIDFNPTQGHGEETIEGQETATIATSATTNNKLLTCTWNPLINGFFFFDTSISIPTSKIRDAILEIKKLRDANPKAMCGLAYLGGIWIRFLTTSKAYLGEPTNSVVVEMLYYRAKEPHTPRLHQDVGEEIEQMLVNKFGGKPHWAKNRDVTFEGMHSRTLAMGKFLETRQRFDPLGLFSSEWSDVVLGIASSSSHDGVQTIQDHCALEGLCICKEDSHCHPTKGYFCRPGLVYHEARVCRYEREYSSI